MKATSHCVRRGLLAMCQTSGGMEGGGATHKCPIVENPHTALGGIRFHKTQRSHEAKLQTSFLFSLHAKRLLQYVYVYMLLISQINWSMENDTQIETQIQLCLTRNILDEVTENLFDKQNVPNMVVFGRESAAVKIAVLRIYEVVQVEERGYLTWQQVVC